MLANRPLPPITVAFALGILFADCAPPLLWGVAAVLLLASVLYTLGRRDCWQTGLLVAGFALLGAGRYWSVALVPRNDVSRLTPAIVTVSGVIVSDVKATRATRSPQGDRLGSCRFAVQRRVIDQGDRWATRQEVVGGVVELRFPLAAVGVDGSHGERLPQTGDSLIVHGALETPPGQRNPGGFDYRGWLSRQGIRTLLTVRRRADWHKVGQGGDVASRLILPLRQGLLAHIRAALPPERAGVLEGLLIGARDDLPVELEADFMRTGTSHLLATAGLHVGFAVVLLLALWRAARVPRRGALLLTLGALILYACMASGRAAMVRACIMVGIVLIGMLLEREPDLPSSVTLAALCLLVYDPRNLSDPGFQLSFATVITILLLIPLVRDPLRRILARRKAGMADPVAVRVLRRSLQSLVAICCLTAAAQIGCAPLMAYYEHELSPVSVLANVLVVPIAPLLLACGFGGAVFGSLSPWLARPFDMAAKALLDYLIGVVHACAELPWAGVSVVSPSVPLIVGYYGVVWGLAFWLRWRIGGGSGDGQGGAIRSFEPVDEGDCGADSADLEVSSRALTDGASKRRDRMAAFTGGAGPIWVLLALLVGGHLALYGWSCLQSLHPGTLRVTFLDVGQGDAAVLELPCGKVLVVDTGGIGSMEGDDEGRRVVGPYLRYRGANSIDALVLTHPHADHIGGAPTLMRDFHVGMLLDNGQDTSEAEGVLEAARKRGVVHRALLRGQSLETSDGVRVQVLAPTATETMGTANNASVVLLVRYGRTAFLLTGDAEAGEEADLLQGAQPLVCDVLKAGHHGSRTSSTAEFLTAAHPRWAIVSVGAHNRYGHPSPEVLTRLQADGITVYRTDLNGAVTCLSNGVNVQVAPFRSER